MKNSRQELFRGRAHEPADHFEFISHWAAGPGVEDDLFVSGEFLQALP